MSEPGAYECASRMGRPFGGFALMFVVFLAACSVSRNARPSLSPATSPPATSAPTVLATTTTTVPTVRYRVRRGDVLTVIAKRFRVSVADIVARNHLTNPDVLAEGQILSIPPVPPLALIVTPSHGAPGDSFAFKLSGTMPGETITFTIVSARGKYSGGPHIASTRGTVTATYQSADDAPAGAYAVTAVGSRGTTAKASFRVIATTTTT